MGSIAATIVASGATLSTNIMSCFDICGTTRINRPGHEKLWLVMLQELLKQIGRGKGHCADGSAAEYKYAEEYAANQNCIVNMEDDGIDFLLGNGQVCCLDRSSWKGFVTSLSYPCQVYSLPHN